MAIATYSDLQSAVAGWLSRTDLTDRIPDFITLAESRLNRDMRLRVMEVEAALTIPDGDRTVALPTGFLEPIALWAVETYGRRQLRYLASVQMIVLTAAGEIIDWSITNSDIDVARPVGGDLALVLRYLEGFTLSDASPTNWLLTNHPDVYLFAALTEAAPYLRDSDALAIWSARSQAAIDDVNRHEARSKGLATLTVDLPHSTRRHRSLGGYGTYG